MKTRSLLLLAVASFCLFFTASVSAQTPTITAQAGYPVGKSSVQVAYGASKYVLLGGWGGQGSPNKLYVSSTAAAWSQIATANFVTTQLAGIAYGAGLFVVVGSDGVIQTSPDGITWTTRTSGTTNGLLRIYYLNSKFFATGMNRTLLTSDDGIVWTTISINTGTPTDYFNCLAYGNGVYLLGGRNGTQGSSKPAVVYRSTTGAANSWTYTSSVFANGSLLNRIQFLNNKFFAFFSTNVMYNSTDGSTWTDFTSSVSLTNPNNTITAWTSSHQIFNGVWDGTKYSFYGSSAFYGGYGSTFTSTNGTNFTLLNKTAYIVPQESQYINGLYLVCGNEGIVSSTDGLVYSHPGGSYRDMVKTATNYVAVGMAGTSAQIFTSTDFTSWADHSPTAAPELYAVAYDGSSLLAAGYTRILRSVNDGNSWTTIATTSEMYSAMAYGNGKFVMGGSDFTNAFLRYSTNAGSTWTTASAADNYYYKIKFVNGRFFALGVDNPTGAGVIMYSTDGETWSNVTPSLGFRVLYYKDVAFDGSKYHFFGVESIDYDPVQFFSVSTATPGTSSSYGDKAVITNTPAGVILGGAYDEGTLDYSNGKFTGSVVDVASGQDYIISSTNGSSWTAYPQTTHSTIIAAVSSGNTVRMAGIGNAFFTVNYPSTLPITLLNFDGKLEAHTTQLKWTTALESGAKQFTVQHSTNGTVWTSLGTVAANNRSQGSSYAYVHTSPAPGVNFYRLLLEDADGKAVQSKVVTVVEGGGKSSVACYPNPATNQLIIRTESSKTGSIILYNEAGQVVKTTPLNGYITRIDVSQLPAGLYRAKINQAGQQTFVSVLKQ